MDCNRRTWKFRLLSFSRYASRDVPPLSVAEGLLILNHKHTVNCFLFRAFSKYQLSNRILHEELVINCFNRTHKTHICKQESLRPINFVPQFWQIFRHSLDRLLQRFSILKLRCIKTQMIGTKPDDTGTTLNTQLGKRDLHSPRDWNPGKAARRRTVLAGQHTSVIYRRKGVSKAFLKTTTSHLELNYSPSLGPFPPLTSPFPSLVPAPKDWKTFSLLLNQNTWYVTFKKNNKSSRWHVSTILFALSTYRD